MGIKDFFQKKGDQGQDQEPDDVAPSGAPVVQGPLRVAGSTLATSLRKKPIVITSAAVIALMGGGAYAAYKLSDGFGGSGANTQKIHASAAPNINVPPRLVAPPVVAPTVSTPNTTPSAAPSQQEPSTAPVQAAAPAPNYTQEDKAKETELTSLITGTGTASTGWKTASTTGSPTSTVPPSEAAAALPKPQTGVYSTHLDRKEVSPYELLQGTVIPAVLETGIKSDLPGTITAIVNQPVYSSVSGAYVLIPAGSKLIGAYQSKIIAGGKRVGVVWNRILFPNGTYMQISKSDGYSPKGYAGFHDLVNNHTWTIFKNALLLSLIDVGMSIASPTSSTTNTTGAVTGNTALQDGEQSLAQTFGQAESQMFQKYVNISPTITIRSGYAFNVIVGKDLVFPGPYKHGTHLEEQAPASVAMPTMANPYN